MATAILDLRLSPNERDGIRRAVESTCGATGIRWRRIVVFGSRTDPARRGGDIDLLVEIDPTHGVDYERLKRRLRLALEDEIGEQRVDIVIDDGLESGPFSSLARMRGVELWSNT
jgi:predicted nucleotidyltransferase